MVTTADRSGLTTHVETVKRLYAAFGVGNVQSVLSMLAPDVVWDEPENPFNPAAGTHYGHGGFLSWLLIGRESEEILELNPCKFLTDGDTVAVVGHTTCRAKSTNRTYDTDFVHLVTFRGGKVARFQEFFDTYAAGEAFRNAF